MNTYYKLNHIIAPNRALNPQACPTASLSTQSPAAPSALGRKLTTLVAGLFALAVLAGCASTKVTDQTRFVHEKLARPNQILVYDFSASPADVPADSAFAGQSSASATPPTAEQADIGRKLGAQIAAELVAAIREMGLPATQVLPGATPQVNDIVIRGYLASIEPGSAAKRMTIGFGSGGSELTTAVEGFQMTATGLRRLGSGTLGAKGSKGPGGAVGVAGLIITGNPVGLIVGGGMKIYGEASGSAKVEGRAKATAKELADLLKKRFQEEGWIN
ncbi:MAG: DUF4410 domain-containing protein [Verrucomicrobia bacterium]|nr:DUF4410 domain-containing protein [Verrucomicrobiota bacterium]